jgi:hypothetical protein
MNSRAHVQARFNNILPRLILSITVLVGIVGLKSDVLGQG